MKIIVVFMSSRNDFPILFSCGDGKPDEGRKQKIIKTGEYKRRWWQMNVEESKGNEEKCEMLEKW